MMETVRARSSDRRIQLRVQYDATSPETQRESLNDIADSLSEVAALFRECAESGEPVTEITLVLPEHE